MGAKEMNKFFRLMSVFSLSLFFGCGQNHQNKIEETKVPFVTLEELKSSNKEGIRILAEYLQYEIQGDIDGALGLITDNSRVNYITSFGDLYTLKEYMKYDSILLAPNYRKQLTEGKLVSIRSNNSGFQMNSAKADLMLVWKRQDGITKVEEFLLEFTEGTQVAYVGWIDDQARVLLPPVRRLRNSENQPTGQP